MRRAKPGAGDPGHINGLHFVRSSLSASSSTSRSPTNVFFLLTLLGKQKWRQNKNDKFGLSLLRRQETCIYPVLLRRYTTIKEALFETKKRVTNDEAPFPSCLTQTRRNAILILQYEHDRFFFATLGMGLFHRVAHSAY